MTVTTPTISKILKAMHAKGVKKKDLATAVGLGSSWVTKLLSGELQQLREEHCNAIEDLLDIQLRELSEVEPKQRFSLEAWQIAELMDRDPIVAEIGKAVLALSAKRPPLPAETPHHIPVLNSKELTKVGALITQIVHRWEEPEDPHYAKIALDTIHALTGFLDKRQAIRSKKLAKKSASPR